MKTIKKLILPIIVFFSLTFASADTVVLNSAFNLNWDPTVTIEANKFSSFSTGDKILFEFSNTEDSYHQIKIYAGDWTALTGGNVSGAKNENGSFVPTANSGTIVYSATSNDADAIRKSGLRMHGFGMRISKITVSSNSAATTTSKPAKPSDGKLKSKDDKLSIYNVQNDLTWDSTILISAYNFASIKNGNKIQLSFKNNSENYHNIKIYSGKWKNINSGVLEGAKNQQGVFVPESSAGTILYTPTSTELKEIKSEGLLIHGFGITLTDISITGSNVKSIATSPATITTEKKDDESLSSPANPKPSSAKGTPFANHGALHVSGAYLYDSKNQKYQLYGMSTHGLNFGNDFSKYVNENSLKNLRDDWNTNCIRLALYPKDYNGYCNGGNKEQLKKIVCDGIDYATKLGLYVIVDWHVHNYNPNDTFSEAKNFLNEISAKYAKYDNVLYEICNEPTNSPWDSAIKPYAEKIIPIIRKNAPNAIILVGTNTWSQDIEGPLANPLSYKNVMYVFHFYANTHTSSYRSRVEKAIKKGLPIFITEFGTCDASGNGGFNARETQKWFDLCEKYNISHMNWSLSNKNETASAISPWCNKTCEWTYSDLSESGSLIYNHFKSLNK